MTEETERRPREMQEELEVEKKKKIVELEELAKEMEKEYENRVKKALAQLRFPLVAPVVLVGVPKTHLLFHKQVRQGTCLLLSKWFALTLLVSCRDVHSDQLKQKAHDFDKKFEKKVIWKKQQTVTLISLISLKDENLFRKYHNETKP